MEGEFDDAIAAGEDGFAGFEVGEAGPERGGVFVFDDDSVTVFFVDADAGDLVGAEPGDGAFDGGADLRRRVLDFHEVADDACALGSAEGGMFV